MLRLKLITITIAVLFICCSTGICEERFPPPQFETNHTQPTTVVPEPARALWWQYADIVVLFLSLALASYLVLKVRKRTPIFLLMLFSLAYFGFWRKGCVCPVGAIQNIALSLFSSNYVVTIPVLIFFLLPLVFTLFWARGFCAAVCPLGAIQDFVLLKPVTIPLWLENALRLLAYVYLTAAVVFAATGSAFIICRYDPFVSLFRFSGNFHIIVLTTAFLIISIFVGRPYCRFLCPYGIILRQLSRLSKYNVTIAPKDCVNCRLCEDSCPFGAIEKPVPDWQSKQFLSAKKTMSILLILLPVMIVAGALIGYSLRTQASRVNFTVRLAERVYLEQTGKAAGTTDASDAFRAQSGSVQQLYKQADIIRGKFGTAGIFAGAFLGLVTAIKLMNIIIRRRITDYRADKASCIACGRCFEYCPVEHDRRKQVNSKT